MLKCTSSQGVVMPNPFGLIAIGELGRRTGLASSALRYYERVGLLSPSARAGGRRHYGASSAERVALIQLCQDAGFTLREIRSLLAAWTRRGRPWVRLAESKLRELDSRILQAERARTLVQHALACPHRNIVTCPNFLAAVKACLDSPERPRQAADEKAGPRVMYGRGKGTRDRALRGRPAVGESPRRYLPRRDHQIAQKPAHTSRDDDRTRPKMNGPGQARP